MLLSPGKPRAEANFVNVVRVVAIVGRIIQCESCDVHFYGTSTSWKSRELVPGAVKSKVQLLT